MRVAMPLTAVISLTSSARVRRNLLAVTTWDVASQFVTNPEYSPSSDSAARRDRLSLATLSPSRVIRFSPRRRAANVSHAAGPTRIKPAPRARLADGGSQRIRFQRRGPQTYRV